ncbi:hypothetical protein [Coleofasciculus sp. E2-BRE-01]|uniref:hypothetical protein n=1 Tax=Coleofasciculus sp. E2-BRE-01 TaxID=3069524 RepID=UPI0032F82D8B
MKFGIVVTTINNGNFIHEYYHHFQSFSNAENVHFYVVGDLSTPASCRNQIEYYTQQGLPWYYLDPKTQDEFLKPFPKLATEIPWQTDNRRNVGFLMAYRDRCDVIIAIDDDNYPKKNGRFSLDILQLVKTFLFSPLSDIIAGLMPVR